MQYTQLPHRAIYANNSSYRLVHSGQSVEVIFEKKGTWTWTCRKETPNAVELGLHQGGGSIYLVERYNGDSTKCYLDTELIDAL